MSLTYAIQGLQPAYGKPSPVVLSATLPVGGRTDVGSAPGTKFLQGIALSVISTTNANEVRTLTLASTPSGTVTVVIYGATETISFSFAATATGTQAVAAAILAYPNWTGCLTGTGSSGGPFVFTFGGPLANMAIGGKWTATITSGTSTWARTTPGSSTFQVDEYSQANNDNAVEGFLLYDVLTDFRGCRVGPDFGTSTGQPTSSEFAASGVFPIASITGLDANAYTITTNMVKVDGAINVALLR